MIRYLLSIFVLLAIASHSLSQTILSLYFLPQTMAPQIVQSMRTPNRSGEQRRHTRPTTKGPPTRWTKNHHTLAVHRSSLPTAIGKQQIGPNRTTDVEKKAGAYLFARTRTADRRTRVERNSQTAWCCVLRVAKVKTHISDLTDGSGGDCRSLS